MIRGSIKSDAPLPLNYTFVDTPLSSIEGQIINIKTRQRKSHDKKYNRHGHTVDYG